jgi:transposase
MTSMTTPVVGVIGSVDTHADSRYAAAPDCLGRLLGTRQFRDAAGYWRADSVVEVDRPDRRVRRVRGKSDRLVAENAAWRKDREHGHDAVEMASGHVCGAKKFAEQA